MKAKNLFLKYAKPYVRHGEEMLMNEDDFIKAFAEKLDLYSSFDAWWQDTMQDRMRGSKYLARKAWSAALVINGKNR